MDANPDTVSQIWNPKPKPWAPTPPQYPHRWGVGAIPTPLRLEFGIRVADRKEVNSDTAATGESDSIRVHFLKICGTFEHDRELQNLLCWQNDLFCSQLSGHWMLQTRHQEFRSSKYYVLPIHLSSNKRTATFGHGRQLRKWSWWRSGVPGLPTFK